MLRCYFNLAGPHEEILDEDGVIVASLDEARAEALKAIAELRREDPTLQGDWNGWSLKIVSESGKLLSTIRLNTIDYPPAGPFLERKILHRQVAADRGDPD